MSDSVPDNGSPSPASIRARRSFKPVITILLAVAVLFVGAAGFQALALLKKEPDPRKPVVRIYNVEVFPVRPTDVPENFPAYGTAEPIRDVVIAAKVAGEIKLTSDTHGPLKTGDDISSRSTKTPLFLIDPAVFEQKVEQAKLQVVLDENELEVLLREKANNQILLDRAEEDVEEYKKEYKRILNAKNKGAAVESELSRARLELLRYETVLTRAKNAQNLYPLQETQIKKKKERHIAERKLAEIDLEHTRILAPFAGKLSEVHVEAGEYVRVGDPLVRLTDASMVEIPMALSLVDFGKIERMLDEAEKSGGEFPRVSLAVAQNSPFRWTGRVVRVASQADEVTRTVKVYVRVKNDNESTQGEDGPTVVVPRMHYFGLIEGPVLKQVIVVPRDAITSARVYVATKLKKSIAKDQKDGKSTTVYDGVAEERKITVRRTFRDLAIVELGLEDGEFVILTNLDVIHQGAKVRFREDQIHDIKKELRDPRLNPDDGEKTDR